MKLNCVINDTNGRAAFTLVEVVIASGIFCMCIFAILGVMSQGLRSANSLRSSGPTAGMVMADYSMTSATNRIEEGSDSGAFGDAYPEYQWLRDVTSWGSNGLFKVDVVVTRKGHIDSTLTSYIYRPNQSPRR